jgi:hypothetical protein
MFGLALPLFPLLVAPADPVETPSSYIGAIIKILLMLLVAIGVFVWWLKRQA